jgi:hypothetical protein
MAEKKIKHDFVLNFLIIANKLNEMGQNNSKNEALLNITENHLKSVSLAIVRQYSFSSDMIIRIYKK